jgi:menaquinol-cytochrome c reductase iron-sulfur subunit
MLNGKSADRRGFLTAIIYGLGGIISAALALPAAIYLLVPARAKKQAQWIDVGDVGSLALNSPEEKTFRRIRVDGWKVTSEKTTAWVVKKSDQEVVAFAPQCTHLGCAYHWVEETKEFLCPCHTSTFSIDGTVLTGPAPRPLDRYEVKLDGTKLQVGKIQAA